MQNGITCATIRTLEDLHAAAPAWGDLWKADPNAKPFQSPDWLLPWARQFASSNLRTIVVRDRSSLAAILPFYLYVEPQTGERKLLLLGAGTSDYLDGIWSAGCTASHVRVALDQVCSEDGWDALDAVQLAENSMLREALQSLQLPGLRRMQTESCSRIPAVSIDNLPRSIREQAKYYRNRAARQGNLELKVANRQNWPEAFAELERLHTSRWQGSGQAGLFADPRVAAWHREALPLLLESGLLRLFTLSLDGETIAVLYSLLDPPTRAPRTQYLYLTAFSIHHADLRPGTVLTALAIEYAAQEGAQIVDMLRGDEPYKRLWHPAKVPTYGFSLPHHQDSAAILDGTGSNRIAA